MQRADQLQSLVGLFPFCVLHFLWVCPCFLIWTSLKIATAGAHLPWQRPPGPCVPGGRDHVCLPVSNVS